MAKTEKNADQTTGTARTVDSRSGKIVVTREVTAGGTEITYMKRIPKTESLPPKK